MTPITLPIAELKPALTGLGKVISRAATLPVLKMVRIERTRDGWITLSGTDLDSYLTIRLEEPTQGEPEAILVSQEDLARILKRCQRNEALVLSRAGDKALIRFPIGNQTGEEHLESLPPGEFPEIPKIKEEPVSIPDQVRLAIQEAFQCASQDETRWILRGAYIDVSDARCHQVVATDGRHLYGSNSFSLSLTRSLLIPDHRALGWKEFNQDGEWQLRASAKEDYLQVSTRRFRLIVRHVEGNYPNWRQVVPDKEKFATTVEFPPEVIASMLAMVPRIPCHDALNKPLGLVIGKSLTLRGRGAGDSRWTDLEVEGAGIKGKPIEVYLNRDFLMKALRFGMTEVQFIDSLSPVRFSGSGKQMIVMPVRGQEPAPAATTTPAEKNGDGKAPAEASPPTPAGEQSTERSTMPKTTNGTANGTTNGAANGNSHEAEKTPLESAFEQIETIKGSYREALRGLNTLTDTIRQIQRDQKSNEREVQNVRTTLEKLQQVRI